MTKRCTSGTNTKMPSTSTHSCRVAFRFVPDSKDIICRRIDEQSETSCSIGRLVTSLSRNYFVLNVNLRVNGNHGTFSPRECRQPSDDPATILTAFHCPATDLLHNSYKTFNFLSKYCHGNTPHHLIRNFIVK